MSTGTHTERSSTGSGETPGSISSRNSATSLVPDPDAVPCVRYGFPEDAERPRQSGTLTSIYERVPEEAVTASPIYFVPTDRYENQFALKSPWVISGKASCIASELQDDCEEHDRVWYPVCVESDSEAPLDEMAHSLAVFVDEVLPLSADECRFYYSGNRSIHVHVPRFVRTEQDRKHLKAKARQWNDENPDSSGIVVDVGLYDRKRQFRLPGVEHHKTGLRKALIEPDWTHAEIFRAGTTTEPLPPSSTYDSLLKTVFGTSCREIVGQKQFDRADDLFLSFSKKKDLKLRIEEQVSYPEYNIDRAQWLSYNAKEFSPYAHAEGGNRSVAALEVKGTPYQRLDSKSQILVPAYFYGAVGCAGSEFVKDEEHAPLQLSKPDHRKYSDNGYGPGDHLIVIGGRNRRSKIHRVGTEVVEAVGELLVNNECDDGRQETLEYLRESNYDVGSAGRKGTDSQRRTSTRRHGPSPRIYPARNPERRAGKLQQQAEQGDITTLTHDERHRIACRLLKIGTWDAVWEWFKEQYGPQFSPTITHQQLSGIVEQYPANYGHVSVPRSPPGE